MDWTDITIEVPLCHSEAAASIADVFTDGGIYIEDYSDIEAGAWEIAHVDLIEEELLQKPRDVVRIHLYLPETAGVPEEVRHLGARFLAAEIPHKLDLSNLRQEDWENAWKQYYHAFDLGKRLHVTPLWESAANTAQNNGRVVLKLDPGMAFGTGTHETTRLCLEALDEAVQGGEAVLDIGCGSGILSIAALLLGAKSALAVDIDDMCVRTAAENAALNGVAERYTTVAGDLAGAAKGKYDIVLANIVADAIIRLAPDIPRLLAPCGLFLASGIIAPREADVLAALRAAGLTVTERRQDKDWLAILAQQ